MLFRKHRDLLWLLLYLVSSLVILFAPVFFQGKVIVPGDLPYTNRFWAVEPDAGRFVPPQNYLLSDQIYQFFVWHSLVSQALQADQGLPLWNPYVFTGQPLVANMQSALFYPPNLLLNWLSPGTVASIRVIFNLLLAALFTFLFARALQISIKGSILAAMAFTLSGPLTVWLGHPHSNVLVTLPLLMWAVEKLIQRPNYGGIGALAIGVGLAFLGGHPETTFHVLAFVSMYIALRLIFLRPTLKTGGACIGAVGFGVLLGAAVSAIQLFPFVDFLLQSGTLVDRGHAAGIRSWFYTAEWLPNLVSGVTAIFPNFFGNPVTYNYNWPFSTFQNYNEQTIYFGLIPLTMMVGLLLSRPRKPEIWIVLGLALFSLAVAWRLPGFEAVNHLPVFSISLNKRLKMVFVFFAAVSGGLGYDAFWGYLKSKQGNVGIVYGVATVVGITLAIVLGVTAIKYLYAPSSGFLSHLCFNIFSLRQIRTMIPLLPAIGLALVYVLFRRAKSLPVSALEQGLIALTVIELVVLAWQYNPMMLEADILPPTPMVEWLQVQDDEPFRLVSVNDVFWPNYPGIFGLESVDGYDVPVYRWYSDLYTAQGGSVPYRQRWQADWPLIDFLNVRFVLTTEEMPPERFRLIEENAFFRVYENLTAMPRAFMVYDVQMVSDQAWLDAVLTNHKALDTVAFLTEMLPDYVASAMGYAPEAHVKYVRRSENEVTVEVSTDQAGLLISSDLYSKDWQATLDGRATKIYRANYAFRAVSVPAGNHTIQFVYRPLWFRLGRVVTLVTLMPIMFLFIIKDKQRRWHDLDA